MQNLITCHVKTSLVLTGLMFATTLVMAQSSYRYTDPETGRRTFSDTPPSKLTKEVDVRPIQKIDPQILPPEIRIPASRFPVTLYLDSVCEAACLDAKALLNKRGVPYTEKQIKTPKDAEELKALTGATFTPSIKVGATQSLKGFEESQWNNLLDMAGYPKTAPFRPKPTPTTLTEPPATASGEGQPETTPSTASTPATPAINLPNPEREPAARPDARDNRHRQR